MANVHVYGNRKDGYGVKKEGSSREYDRLDTKKEAEKSAKDFSSRTGGGEVKFHGPDGKITDSDTVKPGNDPFPPRDRKH